MKLSISKPIWEEQVAALALHQQSWEQLRATVAFEPERRVWAWEEMSKRSLKVRDFKSPPLRELGRHRGS